MSHTTEALDRTSSSTLMGSCSVLLVEDDEDVRSVVSAVLAAEGYQVIVASSIGEALSVPSDTKVDLILSDVHLPDGRGTDAISRLRPLWPDAPVIFMSGCIDADLRGTAFADATFLQKPFNTSRLKKAISAALRENA